MTQKREARGIMGQRGKARETHGSFRLFPIATFGKQICVLYLGRSKGPFEVKQMATYATSMYRNSTRILEF